MSLSGCHLGGGTVSELKITPVQVLLNDALKPLVDDIDEYGAMFRVEAVEVHGNEMVNTAIRRQFVQEIATDFGTVLFLAYKGRIMAGLAGSFKPKEDNLLNNVCLRDVGRVFQAQGIETDLAVRRYSVVVPGETAPVLALGRARGFETRSTRSIYTKEIATGKYEQLQLYTYLSSSEMADFAVRFLHPYGGTTEKFDADKFAVFSITPLLR